MNGLATNDFITNNISVDENTGCWVWQLAIRTDGYGKTGRITLGNDRRDFLAHRLSWILFRGDILNDLCVLHKCDNKPCVNPDHLFLGTRTDNAADRDAKGRTVNGMKGKGYLIAGSKHGMYGVRRFGPSNPMYGIRGPKHPRFGKPSPASIGENNRGSKLKEDDIRTIFKLRSSGLSHVAIGDIVGIKQAQVSKILLRQSWSHVVIDQSVAGSV
jgi:hypothetical protein